MSSSCNGEALARRRTVVAVLRLVVEGPGDLAHGEVVTASGLVVARFRAWAGLVPAVQVWVAREGAEEHPADADAADPAPDDGDRPTPPA